MKVKVHTVYTRSKTRTMRTTRSSSSHANGVQPRRIAPEVLAQRAADREFRRVIRAIIDFYWEQARPLRENRNQAAQGI